MAEPSPRNFTINFDPSIRPRMASCASCLNSTARWQRVDSHIGLLHRGTEKHATIFIDQLREFELGCERPTTPRLAALARHRAFLKHARKPSSHDQQSPQHGVWPTCGPNCAAYIAHSFPGTLGRFCRTLRLRPHMNSAKP